MVLQDFPVGMVHQIALRSDLVDHPGEETSMATVQAVYLTDLKELLFPGEGGKVIPVPDRIAETVSPDVLDLRFVKRWAVRNNYLPETAEIGVAC
jgi:hypothetical protein